MIKNLSRRAAALLLIAAIAAPSLGFAEDETPTPTATPEVTPTATPTATPNPLAAVCKKIIRLRYHQLYKFQASGHLKGTIWEHSCSFICGPGAPTPKLNNLKIFDKKGNYLSAFRCFARRHGNDGSTYNGRFYTLHPTCSKIVRKARQNTGSAQGYIAIGNDTCIKIKNLAGREGSAF